MYKKNLFPAFIVVVCCLGVLQGSDGAGAEESKSSSAACSFMVSSCYDEGPFRAQSESKGSVESTASSESTHISYWKELRNQLLVLVRYIQKLEPENQKLLNDVCILLGQAQEVVDSSSDDDSSIPVEIASCSSLSVSLSVTGPLEKHYGDFSNFGAWCFNRRLYEPASYWLAMAVKYDENAKAALQLGWLYYNHKEQVIPRNVDQALYYFRYALAKGSLVACFFYSELCLDLYDAQRNIDMKREAERVFLLFDEGLEGVDPLHPQYENFLRLLANLGDRIHGESVVPVTTGPSCCSSCCMSLRCCLSWILCCGWLDCCGC